MGEADVDNMLALYRLLHKLGLGESFFGRRSGKRGQKEDSYMREGVDTLRVDRDAQEYEDEGGWMKWLGNNLEVPERKNSITPAGLYRARVGTKFCLSDYTGSASWTSHQKWDTVTVPNKAPRKCHTKIALRNIEGDLPLFVYTGDEIFGYEADKDAGVEIFRERSTGIYCFRGYARKFTYYTRREGGGHFTERPPTAEESADLLEGEYDLLTDEWREFIGRVGGRGYTTLMKVPQALTKWGKHFVFRGDDATREQRVGSSVEEVAARILNTGKGICADGANGFVILLRAIGVPARIVEGFQVMPSGMGWNHRWVEYWDSARWVPIDQLLGASMETPEHARAQMLVDAQNDSERDAGELPFLTRMRRSRRIAVMAVLAAMGSLGYSFRDNLPSLEDILRTSAVGVLEAIDARESVCPKEEK